MDTKPTIETVLERIQDLRAYMEGLQAYIEGLRAYTEESRASLEAFRVDMESRLSRMEVDTRMTNHKLDNMALDMVNLRAQVKELDYRFTHFEVNPNSPTEQLSR